MLNVTDITNVVFKNVDTTDYPDFCDAYIESADVYGRPATEAELEFMMEEGYTFYYLLNDYLKSKDKKF